jgi:ParB/Sulfiredoxin domain
VDQQRFVAFFFGFCAGTSHSKHQEVVMPNNENLSVDVLITDGGTQSRVSISEETVADYTEVIESNGRDCPFPPIVVFHDGNQHLVADGFHRVLAARRAKRDYIPCEVRKGTAQDALRYGMTANDTHGLRPSSADKRNCVELLLDGDEKLTRQEIADIAGVSKRTVQRIASERRDGGVTLSPPSGQSGEDGDFDSFDEDADPFGEGWEGEDGRTDSDGTDADLELPPPPSTDSDDSEGAGDEPPKRTPDEEFRLQKAKAVKTAEALSRAIADLNDLRKKPRKCEALCTRVYQLIDELKDW